MTSKRAVFFDLGGTLFSNRLIPEISMPVIIAAAERLGVEPDHATLGAAYLRSSRKANEKYADLDFHLYRDLFCDTYREFAHELNCEPDPEFVDWLYRAQREVMWTQLHLREDCIDALEGLRERGLSLSIVSNIDEDYFAPMMDHLGLRPYFDHWTSSEEARSCKPHPLIFEQAMQKAGCRADEVVFVGDSRVHDVRGSQGLNITCVLIAEEGGLSHLDDHESDLAPDHTIGSLSELLALECCGGAPN